MALHDLQRFLHWIMGLTKQKEAARAAPLDHGQARFHVFVGTFDSREAAQAYAVQPNDASIPDAPTQLTIDLPEAFINLAHVTLWHGGGAEQPLMAQLGAENARRVLQNPANTWVVLEEEAFGGFPFRLHDTPQLEYLGPFEAEHSDA